MSDRLFRSRDERMLAGVAGGLAEYWDADPSLIRVLWVLLIIVTGGLALLVYIVMAVVVPEEGEYPVTTTYAPPPNATAPDAGPAGGPSPAATFAPDSREARRAAREARRAERRTNRSNSGPVLIGAFLIIVGAFFLVREWLPDIDFDWVWPVVLVVLGVVVLASALRRDQAGNRNEDRGSTG